jgi:hypothetical protein
MKRTLCVLALCSLALGSASLGQDSPENSKNTATEEDARRWQKKMDAINERTTREIEASNLAMRAEWLNDCVAKANRRFKPDHSRSGTSDYASAMNHQALMMCEGVHQYMRIGLPLQIIPTDDTLVFMTHAFQAGREMR